MELLAGQLGYPDEPVRTAVLAALNRLGYQARGEAAGQVEAAIEAEVAQANRLAAAWVDLGQEQAAGLLRGALGQHLERHRLRLFLWCSFIYDGQVVRRVQETLTGTKQADGQEAAQQRSYALEAIDVLLPANSKQRLLPLIEGLPPAELVKRAAGSESRRTPEARLAEIIQGPAEWLTPWAKAAALYTVATGPRPSLAPLAKAALSASEPLIRETAGWCLQQIDPSHYADAIAGLTADPDARVAQFARQLTREEGVRTMLSTVEKVIALKALSLFADTSDEVLAEVAAALKEERFVKAQTIFEKGEAGSSLYIIAEGQVDIHDRGRRFNLLQAGDAFGEMSILDPAPRSAAATAFSDCLLLRLDQESFRDLLNDHSEIAWGVMQLLTQRLRNLMNQDSTEAIGEEAPEAAAG